jgi:hypothetical protein
MIMALYLNNCLKQSNETFVLYGRLILYRLCGWQRHLQFAPLSLAQDPATQASFKHMQFGFAHRAFEPEQKPVVKMGRIVKPIFGGVPDIADRRECS